MWLSSRTLQFSFSNKKSTPWSAIPTASLSMHTGYKYLKSEFVSLPISSPCFFLKSNLLNNFDNKLNERISFMKGKLWNNIFTGFQRGHSVQHWLHYLHYWEYENKSNSCGSLKVFWHLKSQSIIFIVNGLKW